MPTAMLVSTRRADKSLGATIHSTEFRHSRIPALASLLFKGGHPLFRIRPGGSPALRTGPHASMQSFLLEIYGPQAGTGSAMSARGATNRARLARNPKHSVLK